MEELHNFLNEENQPNAREAVMVVEGVVFVSTATEHINSDLSTSKRAICCSIQRQPLLMLMEIMDVYELEGAVRNFGFYVHGRGHSVAHESRQLI